MIMKINPVIIIDVVSPRDFEFVRPNFLYLSYYNEDLVSVIDTSTNTFVNAISSGPSPSKIVSSQ
jgi:YVTN family beta-propeller protein